MSGAAQRVNANTNAMDNALEVRLVGEFVRLERRGRGGKSYIWLIHESKDLDAGKLGSPKMEKVIVRKSVPTPRKTTDKFIFCNLDYCLVLFFELICRFSH